MADAWAEVSLYESRDLGPKLYYDKHQRDLSAHKAQEIVSYFAQGHEYFTSAQRAGDLVRPLLLYDGVLALSRALILFLSPTTRATALKPSHGLSDMQLPGEFSKALKNLADITLRFDAKGTFPRLSEVTRNHEWVLIHCAPYPTTRRHRSPGTKVLPSNAIVTLREIRSRIPALADLYEETFDELSAAYRGFVFTYSLTTDAEVDIYGSIRHRPSETVLRKQFRLPDTESLQMTERHDCFPPEHHFTWHLRPRSFDELECVLPPVWEGEGGLVRLVAPLENGVTLASLSIYFLVSYIMGMLVRYYPTHWHALVTHQKGDLLYPLLREAVNVVDRSFPRRLLQELSLWNDHA